MKNLFNKFSFLLFVATTLLFPQIAFAEKWVALNGGANADFTITGGNYCKGTVSGAFGTPYSQWNNVVHSAPGGTGSTPLGPFNNAGTFTFICDPTDAGGSPIAGTSGSDVVHVCNSGEIVSGNSCVAAPSNPCSGAQSWGSCSATFSAAHGGSDTQSNVNGGFTGSATYSCNNGSFSYVGGSCNANCPGTTPSWGAACSGALSGTTHGNQSVATNATGGYTGSATYTCNNGSWSLNSSTCNVIAGPSGTVSASSCTIPLNGSTCNSTVSWSTSNAVSPTSVTTAPGTTVGTGASNAGVTYVMAYTGGSPRTFYLYDNGVELSNTGATATCASGSWDGSKCAASACSALGAQTWLTNCGAASVPGVGDGATSVVSNTNGGYTGSATWTCNNGSFTGPTATSCTAVPPAAVCGATHYNCTVGSSGSNVSGAGQYTWTCTSGSDVKNCSEAKVCTEGQALASGCDCQPPKSIQGTSCVTLGTPVISATSNPCIMSAGQSSCQQTVTWNYPGLFCLSCLRAFDSSNVEVVKDDGNYSPGKYILNPDTPSTLTLYEGDYNSSPLATVGVTAQCDANSTWNIGLGQCVAIWRITSSSSNQPGAGGTINPLGVTNVQNGNSQLYTITPNPGSAIFSRTVDGSTVTRGAVAVSSTYNFTNVTANHTISTIFYVPVPVTVTVTQNGTSSLGTPVTLKWNTNGNDCNIYDNTGTSLIYAIGAVVSPVTAVMPTSSLPSTVNQFGYVVKCTDSGDVNRGIGSDFATVAITCPVTPLSYSQVNVSTCNNPAPSVTIAPGNQNVVLGQAATFTSVATDGTSDLVSHELEWQKPDGTWSWVAPPQASVSYTGQTLFPGAPKAVNNLDAAITPTLAGVYRVRFAAMDDTLNTSLGYAGYFTPGGRVTYSTTYQLTVLNRVGAEIIPDTGNTLRWRCYNANYMSLVQTVGGVQTTVIGYRSIPPTTGTFTPAPNTSYTLLCETTTDSATFTYSMPELTLNSVTATTANIGWDCKNGAAQSATLQRISGTAPFATVTASSSFVQSGLTPQSNYLYILRCYSGPIVSGNVTGSQVGYANLSVETPATIVDPNPVVISAYIRELVSDLPNSSSAMSDTGAFYDWSYSIVSGTAVSCTMEQQDDGTGWYANVPPQTPNTTYTQPWSSLSASEKQAFVNSFSSQHDWRISCKNPNNVVTKKTWSIIKRTGSIPQLNPAVLKPVGPELAIVPFICVPWASTYSIQFSNGTGVPGHTNMPYPGASGVTFLPTIADNYKITCDNGRPLIVLISLNMWDPMIFLSATSRTIGGTVTATLQWRVVNPNGSCRITTDVTKPAVCDATCTSDRLAASTSLNTLFSTGKTDASDPFWPNGNGVRTIAEALATSSYNSQDARGQVTISGIKYGTTFVGQCVGTPASKVRIGVTTTSEG